MIWWLLIALLAVSQHPAPPWCISGRYFRGWGRQPRVTAGGRSSGRAECCEQLLNHLVTPWQRYFGDNFWAFKVAGLFLQHPPGCKGSEHGLGAPCPWEEPGGTPGRDLGHCWASKLFCASPCSVTHRSSSSLLQGSPSLPWGWGSLGMPLGSCAPSLCHGAAQPPSQAPGKGLSGVTAIDISSAGSPSGSDGILEHGNGSCLVEKANLPQLYRISAGVLRLSPLPPALQPAKEQTRCFKAAAV